ncbi:MAG: iron ABC transporter permease [Candidatus Atribacteria bacterium]|nr:iron ABC transporter permease [Candidatus Atribacteria bacterium]
MKNADEGNALIFMKFKKNLESYFIPVGILSMLIWIVIFILYPYISMFLSSIYTHGKYTLEYFKYLLSSQYHFKIFVNTLRLGLTTASIATLLSFLLAFGMTQVKIKGKNFLHFVYLLPTITPPFLFSLSIIILFGRRGIITHSLLNLSTNIYGYKGLVLAQTLAFFPFAYLLLRSLLANLNPSLDEAALVLGANHWKKFKTITFPLMLHGIVGAFLLVFMFSLTDVGNPIILGGDYLVWASEIYISVIGQYNLSLGAAMALTLIIPITALFFFQKYLEDKKSFAMITGKPSQSKLSIETPLVSKLFNLFFILFAIFIITLYLMILSGAMTKLIGIDYTFTLVHFSTIFGRASRGFGTIKDTLILGGIATVIGTIFVVILGYILVRKENLPAKKILDFFLTIPLAVPGVATGIAYAIGFNKYPFVWSGTAFIVIAILAVRVIPYGLRVIIKGMKQIDVSILDASYILGANDFNTFIKIVLPLIKDSIIASIIYSFTRCITTLSAVIFVVSINWDLVSAAILNKVEEGKVGHAAVYGVVVTFIAIALNLILVTYGRKKEIEA